MDPPTLFVTLPPAWSTRASWPEIEPVLLTMPLLASDTPLPLDAETMPAFEIVQVVPVTASIPSAEPVEVTVPVLVMYRGLSVAARTTGPVVLLLIVLDIGSSQMLSRQRRDHNQSKTSPSWPTTGFWYQNNRLQTRSACAAIIG